MGDVKGFLKVKRQNTGYRPVCQRLKDYSEVAPLRSDDASLEQASRCMDCGTPFCNWACPIGNYIPEWNDLVFHGEWQKAFLLLNATNNLPEITGRLCPAPCEYSCVLGVNDDPVTIRENELTIIEHAFAAGWVKPHPPQRRTNKRVAIIGSGPAGLACADQLNKAGHRIVVFERDDKIGGILRYGIPDFKLEKTILERRLKILEAEGVEFKTNVEIGRNLEISALEKDYAAVCLACGSRTPRDLKIEGRDLSGIYFAMDYLTQSNRRVAGENIPANRLIDAKGKSVVVIGGGDTGSDCVGTAHRQGASCVVQIELLPKPSECRTAEYPWPKYPMILKSSSSHEEGGQRQWSVLTKKFIGDKGRIKKLDCVNVEFKKGNNACPVMKEVTGSDFEIDAEMVVLALGFLHPEKGTLLENIALDNRGNVNTDDNYMTSTKGIFSCGDMRRGQSLVVWAISEARKAAYCIDKYLMGRSNLPAI